MIKFLYNQSLYHLIESHKLLLIMKYFAFEFKWQFTRLQDPKFLQIEVEIIYIIYFYALN